MESNDVPLAQHIQYMNTRGCVLSLSAEHAVLLTLTMGTCAEDNVWGGGHIPCVHPGTLPIRPNTHSLDDLSRARGRGHQLKCAWVGVANLMGEWDGSSSSSLHILYNIYIESEINVFYLSRCRRQAVSPWILLDVVPKLAAKTSTDTTYTHKHCLNTPHHMAHSILLRACTHLRAFRADGHN